MGIQDKKDNKIESMEDGHLIASLSLHSRYPRP
jgi:hypothetical protein